MMYPERCKMDPFDAMNNVLNDWIRGAAENHEALGHRAPDCCDTFAPDDIRRMIDDARNDATDSARPDPITTQPIPIPGSGPSLVRVDEKPTVSEVFFGVREHTSPESVWSAPCEHTLTGGPGGGTVRCTQDSGHTHAHRAWNVDGDIIEWHAGGTQ